MAKCICIQQPPPPPHQRYVNEYRARVLALADFFSVCLTDWVRDNDNKSRVIEYVFYSAAAEHDSALSEPS